MPMGECREQSRAGTPVRWSENVSSQPLYRKSHRDPLSAVFSSQALEARSHGYLFGHARSGPCVELEVVALAEVRRPSTLRAAYDRGRQTWSSIAISYEQFV